MPAIFVQLVEFNNSTSMVQVEYDEEMTDDRLASRAMNLCERGFVHCAVRVKREFLALESKVMDIDPSSGIIYVYQVNCYGGERIVEKIQDKPRTIYLESLCFLNTGFYPAFEKLTVLQYLTLLEDTAGNICSGEPRENYWILKDGEPVNLNVREHRSKLVRTMLPNLTVIVATEVCVNDAEMGCSPIMRYNTRVPSLGCFDLPLLPVAYGLPARCEALPEEESSDEEEYNPEDMIDYVPPLLAQLAHVDSEILSLFGGLMKNEDYSSLSVAELKTFREHHAILYGFLFPKLRGIVDELKKRAPTEAVFELEVAGVKLLFPEVEPDGEPDEVPVEQPSSSTDTASITYNIKNMTAEPFVIKPLAIFVSSSVANLRDEVLKLFGMPLARGKSVKLFVARSQKYIHENTRVKIATVMSR